MEAKKICISVIMAVYNGKDYLEEQLKSIDNQTKAIDEIIIIDDCSKIPCDEIILNFMTKTKIFVQYIKHQENKGYAQTFFEALTLARGEYIFIADQDDIWEKIKVDQMISVLKKNKTIKCLSALNKIIDKNGSLVKKESKNKRMLTKVTIHELLGQTKLRPGMSLVITKSLKNTIMMGDITKFKEHDRLIEFVACENGTFYLLNEYLTQYRIHEHNTSGLNMSTKLRTDFAGRIQQIEKELYYLYNLLDNNIIQIKNYTKKQIKKYILYYENRKKAMKSGLLSYLLFAIRNLGMYSKWKIIAGDIITIIQKD